MKLTLTFEVEIDEAGYAGYRETYPELAAEETIEQTLIREAVASWEYESLTTGVVANGKKVE